MPHAMKGRVVAWIGVLVALSGCAPHYPKSGDENHIQAVERNRNEQMNPAAAASVDHPRNDVPETARAGAIASGFTFEFRFYQRPALDPNVYLDYESVGSGDFNGDGKSDLVFGMESNEIELVLQDAGGGFLAPTIYSRGSESSSSSGHLVIGDFNHDGADDIIFDTVGNYRELGGVAILLSRIGNAPEFRQLHQPYSASSGSQSHGWAAVDVNGDGNLDLIALHNWTASIGDLGLWDSVDFSCENYVPCHHYITYYGDGRGGLSEPRVIKIDGLPAQQTMSDFFVEDVDRDGRDEIVFSLVNEYQSHVTAYVTKLPLRAATTKPTLLHPKVSSGPLFFGDINGDGIKDTIHGKTIFLGMGDGSFSGPYGLAIYNFMEAPWNVLADFDGNGYVDVVNHQFRDYGLIPHFATYLQVDGELQAPFFLYDPPTNHFVKTYSPRQFAAVGDFNSDGCHDIAIAISYSGVLLLDGKNCIKRVMHTGGRLPSRRVRN